MGTSQAVGYLPGPRGGDVTDSDPELPDDWPLIDAALNIIVGRRACTRDTASRVLRDAAEGHGMTVSEMALCVVADRELR
jgi:hypothetical protein